MAEQPPSAVVREAVAADAPAIAELSVQLGYPTTTTGVRSRLEELLPTENLVLVLDDGGAVVGWIHVFRSHRLEEDPFTELGGLIVAVAYRGLGLGRLLMEEASAGRATTPVRSCAYAVTRREWKRTASMREWAINESRFSRSWTRTSGGREV